jgi:hypothetical protein
LNARIFKNPNRSGVRRLLFEGLGRVILHLRRYFRYRGPAKIKIARLRPVVRGKKLLRCWRQNTRMYAFDIYQGRAAECQQKAKAAATEDEQQSWLALADSWLITAELRQTEASQLQNA